VVHYLKDQDAAQSLDTIDLESAGKQSGSSSFDIGNDDDEDELYEDARLAVIEAGKASTSLLQRRLRIGYGRAARLMDILEERGVIGPSDGTNKPRPILEGAPPEEPV
jgi:S-DNA-T family DNA segregation ATPase FtsK/SpoIIIE